MKLLVGLVLLLVAAIIMAAWAYYSLIAFDLYLEGAYHDAILAYLWGE